MKIRIRSKETNFTLRLPTGMILNRAGIGLAYGFLKGKDIPLTKEQALIIAKGIRDFRRRNGSWKLVEVYSADNEQVEIWI